MKTSFPSVTVMMPVRNEQHHLPKAVESVLAQNYPGTLEIILAIGPSVDQTQQVATELAKKYTGIKLIQNPKGLTTVGLNLAIAQSSGEIIIRVDAHSELADNYIARGVEILRETGSVLAGGIMNAKGSSPLQKAVAFGYGSRLGLGGGRYHVGGKAGEAESAYLGIFDAVALKKVSGYDEKIIRGEDWDLAQRLKAQGGKIWFSPELVVNYWPRSNIKALAWQFYSTGVWRGELTRRSPSKASIRYFIPPIALLLMITLLISAAIGLIDTTFLIIPIALYLLMLSLAAGTAKLLGVVDRLMIFIALPVMHLTWASGFWIGLVIGAKKIVDAGDKK
jgi:glycosyltransferase involved in cell wall biosynthesis